ncbi:MAG: hypothetical protein ACXWN2_01885, partial [Candidatus Limnocylindrales bacterium]
ASDEVRAGLAAFEEKQAPDYEALRSRLAPPAAADAGRAQAAPPRSAPDGERHCPFCGRGPLPRDTVFCGYCGQPLLGS